jgi:hypothetical protein
VNKLPQLLVSAEKNSLRDSPEVIHRAITLARLAALPALGETAHYFHRVRSWSIELYWIVVRLL